MVIKVILAFNLLVDDLNDELLLKISYNDELVMSLVQKDAILVIRKKHKIKEKCDIVVIYYSLYI